MPRKPRQMAPPLYPFAPSGQAIVRWGRKGVWRSDPFVPRLLDMGLFGWVSGLRELFERERKRSISVIGNRAYVEFRGVAVEGLDACANLLEEEAKAFANLTELGLEPLTGRAQFQFAGEVPAADLLIAAVMRAEERAGCDRRAEHESERELPDDELLDLQYSLEAISDA